MATIINPLYMSYQTRLAKYGVLTSYCQILWFRCAGDFTLLTIPFFASIFVTNYKLLQMATWCIQLNV